MREDGAKLLMSASSIAGPTRVAVPISDPSHSQQQRPARRPAVRLAAAILTTAELALLAAACGGSPGSRVAQLGSRTSQSDPSPSTALTQQNGALAFSRCMRSHRVPTYPDPGTDGRLPKQTPQELGVSSSGFQTAESACIHLVPNGGQPTQNQIQQYRSVMLVYARCIRAHGVPDMPDPNSRGHLNIGPGTDVDVNGIHFQAAYRICKSKLTP